MTEREAEALRDWWIHAYHEPPSDVGVILGKLIDVLVATAEAFGSTVGTAAFFVHTGNIGTIRMYPVDIKEDQAVNLCRALLSAHFKGTGYKVNS